MGTFSNYLPETLLGGSVNELLDKHPAKRDTANFLICQDFKIVC